MPDKFGGLGLKNILILWMMIVLITVMAKVIFTKYHVNGVSEIVQAV